VGSPEWRRRVSEGTRYGLAKRRQLAIVLPADLAYLRDSGTVAESLRPFFDFAQIEAASLTLAYEGEAGTPSYRPLSPQRKALLGDVLWAGVFMRGQFARYSQTEDADAGSRGITAMARRSAILEKLGLDPAEREVPTLHDYLEAKAAEKRAHATNTTTSVPEDVVPADAVHDAPRGTGGGVLGEEVVHLDPPAVLNPSTDAGSDACEEETERC
jgi:hypothetical protein